MIATGLERYFTVGSIRGPSGLTIQRAYDRLRSEEVALCQVRGKFQLSPAEAAEFGRLVGIDHPFLTKVHDFAMTQDAAFYSREIGLTGTLASQSPESIDPSCIYLCLMGAAEALAALHEAGIAHGLVLAEHVQVAVRGNEFAGTRLADASLRKLLSTTALKARERWDSPEVKAGANVSPASDVYQLGSTLLEALRRSSPLSGAKRQSRLSHLRYRGVDKELLSVLDRCVMADPKKRFGSGGEILRALKASDWALPVRTKSVQSLITDQLVGRENEMGQFVAVLDNASAGEVGWIEFVGAPGMGRSRLLAECGIKAKAAGWDVVRIASEMDPAEAIPSGTQVLLLADDADQIEAGTLQAVSVLAAEVKKKSILIASSAQRPIRLAGAKQIELGPLPSREMKRYLEPLLLSSLNSEETLSAMEKSSGGNPLWVQLLLASWLDSGRLRLVNGRPFLDDRADAAVPATIGQTIANLYATLTKDERALVEAMAVWGGPLPRSIAERVLSKNPMASPSLVNATEDAYTFIGNTIGPVIKTLISQDRIREWSEMFLGAKIDMSGSQEAVLLLQAGSLADGVRKLADEGRRAGERGDHAAAFRHLRDALQHWPAEGLASPDRSHLALEAARVAALVGERHWAREVLEANNPADADPAFQLEWALLYANVLRELRHTKDATRAYAQVENLIQRHPRLEHRSMEVRLEKAANELQGGDLSSVLREVEAMVKVLDQQGPSHLLALAVQRLATIHAHLGQTQRAAEVELRAARLARSLGDYHLLARVHINLGNFYRLLNRPRRALLALDRARAALRRHPNDGLAASESLNRADMLMSLGRIEEAEPHLLRAKALRERTGELSRVPAILISLGYCYRNAGKLRKTATYYREAIALAEEFDLPIALVGQSNLGEVFLHLGEHESAERQFNLSLSERRPNYLGITLINFGRLRRQQRRYSEALQLLTRAEELLRTSAPQYQPLALIDMARVLVEAGDIHGAAFQLSRVGNGADVDEEQGAHYQLVMGLIRLARGEVPHQHFDAAINRVQGSDPTLRGEILLAVLESAMELDGSDEKWIKGHLRSLEEAAAHTDAEPVGIGARLMRGAFAERFGTGGGLGLAGNLQRKLEHPGNAIEGALGELMQQLPGAAGAAVFVVGLDANGKPTVSATPKISVRDERVRPYRLAVREFDKRLFKAALEAADGNIYEAARQLRLPTSTFRYRATKLGLLKPAPRDS